MVVWESECSTVLTWKNSNPLTEKELLLLWFGAAARKTRVTLNISKTAFPASQWKRLIVIMGQLKNDGLFLNRPSSFT
jgi:hypothetical protein